MVACILLLSLFAGIISLDISFVGLIGISRPIITSILLGVLLGDVYTSIKIGTILELCWLNVLPVGAVIPLDVCAVSVLGTSWAIFSGGELYNCIIALMLAIPCGIIADQIEMVHRKFNKSLIPWAEKYIKQNKENKIDLMIYVTILITWIRYALFFMLFLPAGLWLVPRISGWTRSHVHINPEFVCSSLLMLGLAVALKVFWPKKLQLDFHNDYK